MSAQPVEARDPLDPERILASLPPKAREQFLIEYRAAVAGAREVAGYRHLRHVLQTWTVKVAAFRQPDYFERLEAAGAAQGEYTTLEELVARRRHLP